MDPAAGARIIEPGKRFEPLPAGIGHAYDVFRKASGALIQ